MELGKNKREKCKRVNIEQTYFVEAWSVSSPTLNSAEDMICFKYAQLLLDKAFQRSFRALTT